jgi:hypothetical protein
MLGDSIVIGTTGIVIIALVVLVVILVWRRR